MVVIRMLFLLFLVLGAAYGLPAKMPVDHVEDLCKNMCEVQEVFMRGPRVERQVVPKPPTHTDDFKMDAMMFTLTEKLLGSVSFILYKYEGREGTCREGIEIDLEEKADLTGLGEDGFYIFIHDYHFPSNYLFDYWDHFIQYTVTGGSKKNFIFVHWYRLRDRAKVIMRDLFVEIVGRNTGRLLDKLTDPDDKKGFHISPNKIHVIGHGLGAHMAGSAGYYMTSGCLPHITGLDPDGAMPSFALSRVKLDSSAASFIDVIHTDVVIPDQKYFASGSSHSMGDVDFYPLYRKQHVICTKGQKKKTQCLRDASLMYFVHSLANLPKERKSFVALTCDPPRFADWDFTNFTAKCQSLTTKYNVSDLYMGPNVNGSFTGDFYVDLKVHDLLPKPSCSRLIKTQKFFYAFDKFFQCLESKP